MSAIAGFFMPYEVFAKDNSFCRDTIHKMSEALIKRGPDHQEYHLFTHGAFCHNALFSGSIHPQIPCKTQPVTKRLCNNIYTLFYDGYVTNLIELKKKLEEEGEDTADLSQEELLLFAFQTYGPEFVKQLDGAFALVVYDETKNLIYLFRDQLGLRPLYYMFIDKTLIFASEPKGIFAYPNITPTVTREGLNEIFSMGPARSLGKSAFKNLFELKAGHFLVYGRDQMYEECYHQFRFREHTDSYPDTVDHVNELLGRSIEVLSYTDSAPASLLSGGLDSSVITAELVKRNSDDNSVKTFSFDFIGSRQHFKANNFQPSLDAPYVHQMADALRTDHTTLVCGNTEQYEYLKQSVIAHDLPAMGDIDSSLLYFCEKIAPSHHTIFTGECADELFAGYPWYHKAEMYEADTFPWSIDTSPRKELLNNDFISVLDMDSYIHEQYQHACAEIFYPDSKDASLLHSKTMYLTMRYFMQTLVNRTDRAASANSLDIRVPFADFSLAEYLFNVPYEMKAKDGEVKHLLREYAKGLLPEEIRVRRKSPYPKTYDPGYEALLSTALLKVISDSNSPLLEFVDKNKVYSFCQNTKDYGRPWYGQLMAGPQLMAYYLQINYWLQKYQIKVELS